MLRAIKSQELQPFIGGNILGWIKTKWGIILDDLTKIISAKIGSNWPNNLKSDDQMWIVNDVKE